MKHVVHLQDFTLTLKGTVMNCIFPWYFNIHTFGLIVAAIQGTNHNAVRTHVYAEPPVRCKTSGYHFGTPKLRFTPIWIRHPLT